MLTAQLHSSNRKKKTGNFIGIKISQSAGIKSRWLYLSAMEKINLAEKLSLFTDYFSPKVVGELNGQQVKLVKFKGEFVWDHHD